MSKKYDFILANINKNILKADMQNYIECLNENGLIAISGFFKIDCEELIQLALSFKLLPLDKRSKDDWAAMVFQK